jgi:DTW domain-containing protein YfiP
VCGRPLRVCYCAALPAKPVQLTGRVVILQHPHEQK